MDRNGFFNWFDFMYWFVVLLVIFCVANAACQEVPNSMVTFECTQDAQTMALLEGFTDSGKEIHWWMVMYNLRSQPIPYGTYSLRVQNQYAKPMDLEGTTIIDDNKVVTLEGYKFIETTQEYVSFPISIAKVVVNKLATTVTFRIPTEIKVIRKVSTTYTQLDPKGAKEGR